jgi:peptide-N-glycosidase F-like protein
MRSALALGLVLAVLACSPSEDVDPTPPPAGSGGVGGGGGGGGMGGGGAEPAYCEPNGFPVRELDATGPFGILRHDLADDFAVTLRDGTEWRLSAEWSGCESYVFVPSARSNSALDPTSIWERDVDVLLAKSPPNAHYFFVASRDPANAEAELTAMQGRIDAALGALDPAMQEHWRARLHLVRDHASALGGWLGTLLAGLGEAGFGVDRAQRIRLLGSFADVNRFDQALQNAGQWPWEANLGYAAYEVRHFEAEAARDASEAAMSDVTVVTPWQDEVLADTVEKDVAFPDAATMATFDSFQIDLTMDCSDPAGPEFGNCGAWDYLSQIYLLDDDGVTWVELGRFITTYHREGRYLVDATPMLVHLRQGGMRTLRFVVSPPWNPQAYLTRMDLRFANTMKGQTPSEATYLFSGADFNSGYNALFQPIDVPIPATATRVELWAIITGHGGATQNCAEFCRHQHEFTVNGHVHTKDHPLASTPEGCVGEIEKGMVPNQGGTWWYGRGGWCPGQQVDPWVEDVTADVTPGATATVSYRGLLNGNEPPDNAGNIVMTSYLVVYE